MAALNYLSFYFQWFITGHLKWALGLMAVYDIIMLQMYSYVTPTLGFLAQIVLNGFVSMVIAMLITFAIVCPIQTKIDIKTMQQKENQ